MEWQKKGLIFSPAGKYDWSVTHAQLPIADINHADKWRIYYSSRNKAGQSNIGYIDVRPGKPEDILYIHPHALLPFGRLGTFDESGLMPVSVVTVDNLKYLYYAGWSLKKTVPYHNTIGLAISEDGGNSFVKYGEGPLFDTTPFEPFSNGTAHILKENGLWKAWYQSITRWMIVDGRPEPFYHLKYAESDDGIQWKRSARVAIDYRDENEAGICSAAVMRDKGKYKMWYSFRSTGDYRRERSLSYRIGYAESADGVDWTRMDQKAGIDVSPEGWDSEMISYPNVVTAEGKSYLFYNGNGFGRSGFGYAVSK